MYLIQRLVTDWTVWGFDVVDSETCYLLVNLRIDVFDSETFYWLPVGCFDVVDSETCYWLDGLGI